MKKKVETLLGMAMAVMMAGQAFALTMTGSTTVFPIAQFCAEVFSDNNPKMKVSVRGGGSSVGIAALLDSTTDIGLSSRPITSSEIKNCKMKGVDPYPNVIAWDGIAIIVDSANTLEGITVDQLRSIFSGKITNWGDLGIKRGKIVMVSRDTASGTYESFNTFVMKGAKVAETALMQASNQAVLNIVASTPGAIGYVGMGYITDKFKTLPVNGVSPSKETVKSKKYPFSRPLFMYTNGKPKGDAAKFLDFVFSAEGQAIVEEEGFVSIK